MVDKARERVSGPRKIQDVFPGAPGDGIDVAITSGTLTVLLKERTLFGYVWKYSGGGQFKQAVGYPRALHSRVLFYPEAAFPLRNESVVLLRVNYSNLSL